MTTAQALSQILQENGIAILDDHNRVRAYLKDLAPTEKAKNLVLVTCIELGLHKRLETQSLDDLTMFIWEERGLDQGLVKECLNIISKTYFNESNDIKQKETSLNSESSSYLGNLFWDEDTNAFYDYD